MKRLSYLVVGLLLLSTFTIKAFAQTTEFLIENISGNLWKVQNDNNYFTTFLVTTEGIILTDPIETKTALWIEKELKARFDLPVKYIIYSHSHYDHAGGSEVFEDAIVVAHENAPAGMLEQREESWNADIVTPTMPQITFSDEMTLELGGETVRLFHLGEGHTDNLIAIHFPDYRALFAVDILWIDRVGYQTIRGSTFPGWFDSLRRIEAVDFDILIPAHGHLGETQEQGKLGTKAHVKKFASYFEDLYEAVLAAKREGMTLEEAKKNVNLPQHSHLGMYDEWFVMNVEGMYLQTPAGKP